ncbi:MAG: SGNH/GDSL hydrolase family protein [Candidatus Omnitrophica bacterium]|nr:SGNH/GDSL hydrolase family protein [Candidatus Omnitrophota bacterium]
MKKLFFFLFSLVLWFMAFAIIFEISCRIYYSKDKHKNVEFTVKVPFLEYRTAASVPEREDQATRYSLNSFGFRGKDFTRKKQEGVYRIIAIGDSCTFGVGVSDDAHTYTSLLESKLKERLRSRKIEVINAGIPGYLCLQSLISYVVELADYEPDMIIVSIGWNELGRPFSLGLNDNINFSYEGVFVGANRLNYPVKKKEAVKLEDKLASVRMIKKWHYKILRWKNKKKLFSEEKKSSDVEVLSVVKESYKYYASNSFYMERANRIYERCLDSLLAFARGKGVKVLVLTLPQLVAPDMTESYYKKVVEKFPSLGYFAFDKEIREFRNALYWKYDSIIKETAKRNGCFLVDVVSYFPKDDSNIDLFYDHVHLNDKGSDLQAELVCKEIQKILK